MISDEKNFIFLHIPKCGGNSILEKIKHWRADSYERFQPPCHLPISQFPLNLRKTYFKFTFVRNPWDRFVSAYSYLKKGGNGVAPQDLRSQKRINKYNSFSDFVKDDNFFEMWHFKPLSFYIDDEMDFIGKVENLQQDFNIVCDKIGIPHQELPHKNKSKHKHYIEYYSDETIEIVAKKYAKDIEYFGYKFGD